MTKVYLGLGSNVNPQQHLRLGIRALSDRYGVLELSNIYRSKAVGFEGDDFLNLVVGLDTEKSPADIHRSIAELHALAKRQRGETRFSPRTLDVDLLLYGDQIIDTGSIRVPRADVLKYSFVLGPLAEIAPQLRHPETGKTMAQHWAEFDKASHPITLTVIDDQELPAD